MKISIIDPKEKITREDIQNNKNILYIYGDNDLRKGYGEESEVARDEPNSLGIRIKKAPSMNDTAFYTDQEFNENCDTIANDIRNIIKEKDKYQEIKMFPLGTSLAQLEKKAPKTCQFLRRQLNFLKNDVEISNIQSIKIKTTKENNTYTSKPNVGPVTMIDPKEMITREEIKKNPDILYVFGDNDIRKGYGGAAKVARDEKNSIGVRVKKLPSLENNAFYTDKELNQNCDKIFSDFKNIRNQKHKYKEIKIFPLGTGLAKLEEKAPKTFNFLNEQIKFLKSEIIQDQNKPQVQNSLEIER